jgi:hypothetical protein
MNYLSKYLKYKSKYISLKHQIGGTSYTVPETFRSFLQSKGIRNIYESIPKRLSYMVNELYLQSYQDSDKFRNLTWIKLIYLNDKLFSTNNDIITIINTYFDIPEIIRPSEELNYDDRDPAHTIFDYDDFDLSEMTASDAKRTDKTREFAFQMTHLLFDKGNFGIGYTLSALHYTSDDSDRENIIKILKKYYTNYDYLPENEALYTEKLIQISSPSFLTTNKYMRVGCLKFSIINESSFYIDHIDAWIMEKGSGLQMLCSLLKIFLPTFKTILLRPASDAAKRYWRSLGFTENHTDEFINTNISETILSKCSPLESNVKLILKLNDNYTTDLEAVKKKLKK